MNAHPGSLEAVLLSAANRAPGKAITLADVLREASRLDPPPTATEIYRALGDLVAEHRLVPTRLERPFGSR